MDNPKNSWSQFAAEISRLPPLELTRGWAHLPRKKMYYNPHRHNALEMVYHPSGSGSTRLADGTKLEFSDGSMVVYAPGELHDQMMDSAGEDQCIHLSIPQALASNLKGGFCLHSLSDPLLIPEIHLLTRNFPSPTPAQRGLLNLRGTAVLLSVVDQMLNSRRLALTPGEKYLQRAEEFIQLNFHTVNSVAEVAQAIGISTDYLRHLFRAHRKTSLVQRINLTRIQRAQTLLIHSGLDIKSIARECGFRDVYYFSLVFRKITHKAPGGYRKEFQKQSGASASGR